MNKSVKFWDRIAEKYAKSPIRDMEGYEATLDMTRAHLKPTDHVLELGCGTGTTSLKLAPSVARITATDYAEAMVAICTRRAEEQGIDNVTFRTADPFDPALEVGGYDVVMGWNFYHLMDDMAAGFRRSHELLVIGYSCRACSCICAQVGTGRSMVRLLHDFGYDTAVVTRLSNGGHELCHQQVVRSNPAARRWGDQIRE